MESQPAQARYIHVAATYSDEKNHACVRYAQAPYWHRYDADMAINEAWYRYHVGFDCDVEQTYSYKNG